VIQNRVTILGPLNLPSMVPYHASQMYASNMAAFLRLLVRDGALNVNLEDQIVRETLVTHGGRIVNARVAELVAEGAVNA
jgi:H+-translocating NAD(P) transhydrogenase subunit alpha